MLAAHALLLIYSAVANSATFDEPAHLAAGVEYLCRHDFSIYSLSPPLLRLWAAVPAVLAGANAPPLTNEQTIPVVIRHLGYVNSFILANFSTFPHLLVLARLGMIPISCFAGWIVYRWGSELYGWRSGVAACAIYCLNPSILAAGSLVTTDLGTAATMLLSCWLWWRFCRGPSWRRWSLACVAVVLAHLCKFTALLLWPMLLGMVVPFALLRPLRQAWKLPAAWIALGAAALLVLNAIYGFHGSGRALGSYSFDSDFMQKLQEKLPAAFPSPLPKLLMEGFDAQKRDTQGGYEAFLFGEMYRGTRWYYYPAALLCKLPVAMLLLLAAAGASALARSGAAAPARHGGEWSIFLAIVMFAAGVMIFGDMNIGTRYLLPIFPLFFILTSRLWAIHPVDIKKGYSEKPRAVMPYLRDALVGLLAVETLLICPRFLSFVNFAVGGPSNGWRVLTDSDFDWGQSLIDLRKWMSDHQIHSVALAYFGGLDPAVYHVQYTSIIDASKSRYVAFSSYYLDGLTNRVEIGNNQRGIFTLQFAKALQSKRPVGVAGYTIFIYSWEDVRAAALEMIVPGP